MAMEGARVARWARVFSPSAAKVQKTRKWKKGKTVNV